MGNLRMWAESFALDKGFGIISVLEGQCLGSAILRGNENERFQDICVRLHDGRMRYLMGGGLHVDVQSGRCILEHDIA